MRRAAVLLALPLLAAAAPDARARLQALNAREAELSARMGANRTELVRLLSGLQRLRRDPPPALLVRPDRARDAARAAILLKAVTPELQRRARSFAAEAEALRRVRREAAEAGEALFAAESAAAEGVGGVRRPRPGDLLPPPAPEPEPAADAPPPRLRPPLPSAPERRFGEAEPGGERSRGWRWTAAAGAPVSAPLDGVVEHAGPLRGRGLVVVLRAPGGWRVVLTGLRRLLPAPGSTVTAGSRLGDAAGGELLLELRRGAEPVDPGPALAGR